VEPWPEPVERVAAVLRERSVHARLEEFEHGTGSARDAARAAAGGLAVASDALGSLAFPQPLPAGCRLDDFEFSAETLAALGAMHGLYDATDPDLGAFAGRHGRLLMWHGWADPHISPTNSIAYAQAVADTMGSAVADATLRLFLVPGMYHCGDGDGLTSIDVLTPLMAWTEDGKAPDRIVASRSDADAAAGKARPVFPWPATARLRAGADPDRPKSWRRTEPATTPPKLYDAWLGAAFFAPGYERECGFDGEVFACHPRR
jgi:feruloyl esterase